MLLAASFAIALAGCGGSHSPSVANITTTSSAPAVTAASSAGQPGGAGSKPDPAGLLVEWAACMRRNGDPEQTDPTIDDHFGINVVIPTGAPPSLSNEVHGGTAPCNALLAAASSALRASHPVAPGPSSAASGVQFAACMRANGVPAYPDPTGSTTDLRGIDTNSPFFVRANKLCGEKIHAPAWWINGWGPPGNISVTSGPVGQLARRGGLPPTITTTARAASTG